jgi:hypothetical protein
MESREMAETLEKYIDDFKIREIMMPGTHDSGCYNAVSKFGEPCYTGL